MTRVHTVRRPHRALIGVAALAMLLLSAPTGAAAAGTEPTLPATTVEKRLAYELFTLINRERIGRGAPPLPAYPDWTAAQADAAHSRDTYPNMSGKGGHEPFYDFQFSGTQILGTGGLPLSTGSLVHQMLDSNLYRQAWLDPNADFLAVGVVCDAQGRMFAATHLLRDEAGPMDTVPATPRVVTEDDGSTCADAGAHPNPPAAGDPTARIVGGDGPVGVTRHAGPSRIDTAVRIANASHPDGADTVLIATGYNFPDALAAAPAAVALNAPILLAEANDVPKVTVDELYRLEPSRIVMLGGTATMGWGAEGKLAAYERRFGGDGVIERWAGSTRTVTATVVADSVRLDTSVVWIASATDWRSPLAAAVPAAAAGQPVLLTGPDALDSATRAWLAARKPRTVRLVGGTGYLSAKVADAVKAALPDATVARIEVNDPQRLSTRTAELATQPGPVTYLATADAFPDALTGAPLIASHGGRLLLADPGDARRDVLVAHLTSHCPGGIVVLGGPAALPDRVAGSLARDVTARC